MATDMRQNVTGQSPPPVPNLSLSYETETPAETAHYPFNTL